MQHSSGGIAEILQRVAYKRFNTGIVGLYKLAGFTLLSLIVVGMGFYLAVSGFYLLSRGWAVPLILSPGSEKVAQARLHLLEQEYQLGKLQSEYTGMKREIEHIRYAESAHRAYQDDFLRAMDDERSRTRKDLERTRALVRSFRDVSKSAQPALETYRRKAESELSSQFERRIIDQGELLRGQMMLSQIDLARLSQRERLAELQSRTESLEKNLDALGHGPASDRLKPDATPLPAGKLPFEIVVKEQPLLQSLIASSELRSRIEPLEQRMQGMQKVVDEYAATVERMRQTPFARAARADITAAFVPYENLHSASPGTRVTACLLEFILCRRVGEVVQVIEGEQVGRHPVSGRDLRGQLVELKLEESSWARNRSLVLGRAPLLL